MGTSDSKEKKVDEKTHLIKPKEEKEKKELPSFLQKLPDGPFKRKMTWHYAEINKIIRDVNQLHEETGLDPNDKIDGKTMGDLVMERWKKDNNKKNDSDWEKKHQAALCMDILHTSLCNTVEFVKQMRDDNEIQKKIKKQQWNDLEHFSQILDDAKQTTEARLFAREKALGILDTFKFNYTHSDLYDDGMDHEGLDEIQIFIDRISRVVT